MGFIGSGRLRALALALVTGVVAIAITAAGTGSARTPLASGHTVSVVEHAITDTEAPGVKGADVAGNVLYFHNPVFNTADTKQVGHDEGFCTRIDPKLGIWECLWTTFLKGGQITVQGPYYDKRNSVLTITGGTGIYDGVRGSMPLISRDGGKKYDFVFNLL